MISCCRTTTFSASSRLFDLNGEAKTATTKQRSATPDTRTDTNMVVINGPAA
jgi:hypothetical protein